MRSKAAKSKSKKLATKNAGAPDDSAMVSSPAVKGRPLNPIQPGALRSPRFQRTSEREETTSETIALEYRSRILNVKSVCDTIDREVDSRSVAINAVTGAQLSSIKAELDLQVSQLPPHVQTMPLMQYLKSCPDADYVVSSHGKVKLRRKVLGDTKKATGTGLRLNSTFVTPGCAGQTISLGELFRVGKTDQRISLGKVFTLGKENQRAERNVIGKGLGQELSWPEYYARLRSLEDTTGSPISLGDIDLMVSQETSAVKMKGSSKVRATPKTIRLPRHGEVMLSINGSPLGQFGTTPGDGDCRGKTKRSRRDQPIAVSQRSTRSAKRSLRDL